MECWLQSTVKDVVRLIARLLWGTKMGRWIGWRNVFVTHLVCGTDPFGVGQGRRADSEVTTWTG
jgi:hypothetical protein